MTAVLDRYLAARRLSDEPGTVKRFNTNIRQLIAWIEQTNPELESFAQLTRDHILAYADFLTTNPNPRTGQPLATSTRRQVLSSISVFFQEVVAWEWEDVPSHPPLHSGDLPKLPQRVPRYIPEHELDQLMLAIRALQCPYQRAALLVARWSGARREEIRRLPFDCLDTYPDGTPRLHVPAGKTKRERLVPLNQEAADAIRVLQTQHKGGRGLRDRQTGTITRYLFMQRGKLLSCDYLFDMALETACAAAGLVTTHGKPIVTAHRFRHTVGTQLARRGARLRTIQKILGHESIQMSVVYIGITDDDVRTDYQRVLGSDAHIAGPGAELIRSGALAPSEIRWIKENFFKTELELGRCLRLPQEGACECDLYLTCAKFVTSSEYAPRLRRRRRIEQELVEDAAAHGWQREVERHQCTLRRLEQLLADLGEPIEGAEATD
jgi:site-specific recombinase XerD